MVSFGFGRSFASTATGWPSSATAWAYSVPARPRAALRAWARDRPHAVPGLHNVVLTWAGSCLPRAAAARVAGLVLRRRAGPGLP